MRNTVSKLVILSVAVAIAIGSVLFFIRYVVNPPADISAEATADDVFNPDIKNKVNAYHPDSLSLGDAENTFDALVDRANIFIGDSLIRDKKDYNVVIVEASERFAKSFISWSTDKFSKSSWNAGDHEVMLRLIGKMREISIDEGAKKALSSKTLSSLTEIESVVNDYKRAWGVTKKTYFTNYPNVTTVRNEARVYATKKYLSNCTNLVNALNIIGEKQEVSCYNQLYRTVERLQYLYYFENRRVYESESKRIYGLIKEFKETKVFGISTANHAKMLADLQDRFDSNAENHEWPDENN